MSHEVKGSKCHGITARHANGHGTRLAQAKGRLIGGNNHAAKARHTQVSTHATTVGIIDGRLRLSFLPGRLAA